MVCNLQYGVVNSGLCGEPHVGAVFKHQDGLPGRRREDPQRTWQGLSPLRPGISLSRGRRRRPRRTHEGTTAMFVSKWSNTFIPVYVHC